MTLESILKDAIKEAIGDTIAGEVREIVAKETRRTLRDRETELTDLVKGAVASAIGEMLNGAGAK
jgi:hypothetical protein